MVSEVLSGRSPVCGGESFHFYSLLICRPWETSSWVADFRNSGWFTRQFVLSVRRADNTCGQWLRIWISGGFHLFSKNSLKEDLQDEKRQT